MSELIGFDKYIETLKSELSYVEDETFSWDDVVSILVILLRNTDSLNKANEASNATQIQITSERSANDGMRKTEDFFPTLTLNSSFKSWKIAIPVRLNAKNIEQLGGSISEDIKWLPDRVQIRRRLLNPDENGGGNPNLQICYGNDIMPLRERLNVDDYLVFVKRKNQETYEAFGVKTGVDLGSGKNMYISSSADKDSTAFDFGKLIQSSKTTGEQKMRFRYWMTQQKKANGDPYSVNTINTYIAQMERGYAEFKQYKEYASVFGIQSADEIAEYKDYLFNADGFDEFNDKAGNKALSNGIIKYEEFLNSEESVSLELRFNTPFSSGMSRNRIVFGAPGTGKSFMINEDRKKLLGENNESDYERVTFHPDYSYANFVGTYKPVPRKDEDGKEAITYEYVPGPFMRVYVNALKNGRTDDVKPYLLIIEEINRANVAAVFGDVFQLLDRDENEVSEYPIQASEDIKKYLVKELGGSPEDYSKIKIPNNMFIWATMNSADQGVYPMDTAFKRRWNFTYIGIDDNDADICGKYVILGKGPSQKVEWNKLRKAINHFLANQKINEDKQLGPYFISRKIVVPESGDEIDKKAFIETFKNKVIMYLFEDAAKQKRSTLFEGCFENRSRYSEICKEFEEKGIGIFNHEISMETAPEDISFTPATETETAESAEK